jgi:hypothetical protein
VALLLTALLDVFRLFEHPEHAVGDEKTANRVGGGTRDGEESQ